MNKASIIAVSIILAATIFTACTSGGDSSTAETTETTTPATTITTTGEAATKTAAELVEAIENSVEWTMLVDIDDATILKDNFLLDKDNPNYEEISVKQAGMSAAFAEIIVIKAKSGKVDDAVKDLEARKKKLIDTDAFYPEHKTLAENALVAKEGDYAYLIVHEKSTDAEKALKDALAK